jgi:hypothetical protein
MYLEKINGRKYRSGYRKACKMTHAEIRLYRGPVFMIDREKGAHEWMIEFKGSKMHSHFQKY